MKKSFSPRGALLVLIFFAFFPLAAMAATLSLSPASGSYTVGGTISVNILLNTAGSPIDGTDIRYLNYNPALLQIVDENASQAGVQIAPGTLMPVTPSNSVDSATGKISFSQVTSGGTTFTNSTAQTLATVRFNVLGAGSANLSFNAVTGSTADTNVSSSGSDLLTAATGASYATTAPGDAAAPVTAITAPLAGTTVAGTVSVTATASDNIGVARVEFFVDGALKSTDTASPYSFSWDTTSGGVHACLGPHTHTLTSRAYDAAGNVGTSAGVVVNMNDPSYCTPADTTTPVISGITSSSITQNSAAISWSTNELSTHQVEYGLSASYGLETAENTTLMTSHIETLSALAAGSTYHYRVKSKDAAGNLAVSLDRTFTTLPAPDTQAPAAITNLAAGNIDQVSARLSWTAPSDPPSNGAAASYDIRYALTPLTTVTWGAAIQVTGEPPPASAGVGETYTLAGLSPGTLYYVGIRSTDAAGNLSSLSNVVSLFTAPSVLPPPPPTVDATAPIISNVTVGTLSTNSAAISWTTNEPADSKIIYGTTAANLNQSVEQATLSLAHTLTLPNLQRKTTYYYRVISKDAAGNATTHPTLSSTPLSFTTSSGKPLSVRNLKASKGSTILSWELPPDPFIKSFKILRRSDAYAQNLALESQYLIATITNPAAASFTDTTPPPGTINYYSVFTVDDAGIASDPATVSLSNKFNVNDRIENVLSASVREAPSLSAPLLSIQSAGSRGAVIGGPFLANGAWWWNLNYESGADGWSAEDELKKSSSQFNPISFSNVATTPNATANAITYHTDLPAYTRVEYGPSILYGANTPETSSLATSHAFSYQNLSPCAAYHARLYAKNFLGEESVSTDYRYATKGCLGNAPVLDSATRHIFSSTGGTLSLGALTLLAPPAFASQNLALQILRLSPGEALAASPLPGSKRLIGAHLYEFKALLSAASALSSFAKPLTVTLNLDSSEIAGLTPSSLTLARWDGSSWAPLPGCVFNAETRAFTCQLSSFSTYAVVGDPAPSAPPPPPPPPASGGGGSSSGGGGGGGGGITIPLAPAPASFMARGTANQILLTWTNPKDANFVRVKIYRATSTLSSIAPWEQKGTLIYEGDKEEFSDSAGLTPGITYSYGIVSVNKTLTPSSIIIAAARLGDKTEAQVVAEVAAERRTVTPFSLSPSSLPFASSFRFTRPLAFGSRGEDIKNLQRMLVLENLLTPKSVVGYFGPLTQNAVKAFQRKYEIASAGVKGYGLVGPKTRAKLNALIGERGGAASSAMPSALAPEARETLIAQLREQLLKLTEQLLQLQIRLLQEQGQ